MNFTYFDRSVKKINAIHIIEEAHTVGNYGAVTWNGEPIDLIGDYIVESGHRTKESAKTACKSRHISVIGIYYCQQATQLITQAFI